MPELRWALIGLGLLFLGLLALWEWRRSRHAPPTRLPETTVADITLTTERPRRLEPDLGEVVSVFAPRPDDALEVPSMLAVEPLTESVRVAAGSAVDVPAAARGASGEVMAQPVASEPPAASLSGSTSATSATLKARAPIRWPPRETQRVLALRLVKADGSAMAGRALRIALESAGLVSGPQTIYHRPDADGAVILSAANLVRPGTLDPDHMDTAEYRGLSMFSVLPGPLPAVRMLEELVATARSIAHRVGAVVQDEKGADLDGQRLTELRRALPPDRQEAAGPTVDGSAP
jgi:cell division protein ZipA